MTVTFDTMTLIWGVKRKATPGQEHMVDKAQAMLRWLAKERHKIVLTTTALAEYLGSFDAKERAEQRVILLGAFPVITFNMNAADIAAELLAKKELVKQAREDGGCSRQIVKADIAIIATAAAHGVSWLFSEDKKVRTAAAGKILVKRIADVVPEEDGGLF